MNKIFASLVLSSSLVLLSDVAAAAACTSPQPSGPVSTTGGNSCQLTAISTTIDAIYVYANAGGVSVLSLPGFGNIFSNGSNSVGNTVLNIPTTAGQLLDFTLNGPGGGANVFVAGVAGSDGQFHAAYRDFTHFSDYNVPAIGPGNAAYNYMAANGGLSAWTFVAWEDVVRGDYDYNDLVFAFRGVTAAAIAPVSEPATGSMLVIGLALLACRVRTSTWRRSSLLGGKT